MGLPSLMMWDTTIFAGRDQRLYIRPEPRRVCDYRRQAPRGTLGVELASTSAFISIFLLPAE